MIKIMGLSLCQRVKEYLHLTLYHLDNVHINIGVIYDSGWVLLSQFVANQILEGHRTLQWLSQIYVHILKDHKMKNGAKFNHSRLG